MSLCTNILQSMYCIQHTAGLAHTSCTVYSGETPSTRLGARITCVSVGYRGRELGTIQLNKGHNGTKAFREVVLSLEVKILLLYYIERLRAKSMSFKRGVFFRMSFI